jgi:poly(A) polymerase Pap1
LRWKELRCLSAVAQRLPFVSGITFYDGETRLQRRQQWLKLQGWVESRLRHLILKLETLLLKTGLAHPFPDAFQSPDTQERRLQLDRTSCRDAIAPLQRGFVACRLRFV